MSMRGVLSVAAVVCASCVVVSCHDPTAPWPPAPANPPRLASITEWVESEPNLVQRGVFHYDDQGRLDRFELGRLLADSTLLTTDRVAYTYEGGQLASTETYARDFTTNSLVQVGEALFSYDAGRLASRLNRSFDDQPGGALHEATTFYEYNGAGRLTAVRSSQEVDSLSYDGVGNVTTLRYYLGGSLTLVYRYSYDRSFNPLAGAPPAFEGVIMTFGGGNGVYNLASSSTAEPGKAPASTARAEYVFDAAKYPLSRVLRATNTSDPSTTIVFHTVFAYAQ